MYSRVWHQHTFSLSQFDIGGKDKKVKKKIEVDLDNSKLLSLQMGKSSYLEWTHIRDKQIRALLFLVRYLDGKKEY